MVRDKKKYDRMLRQMRIQIEHSNARIALKLKSKLAPCTS